MNSKNLPVYEQKKRILDMLEKNQVIVVQSPTGSGKTTQLPIILHEAGYAQSGIIAVTQPRRIAALSVSEFIAKQLNVTFPGLVGYKMRFEDKTDHTTRIKIMTDGILLQEMKLDPYLSKYSVIMVDEAHERSLNIDFVLGLLKRILKERHDFKVIISSATMNTELFSAYFDNCPIVTIDTITYPVTVLYDTPVIIPNQVSASAEDALILKIAQIVERVVNSADSGDMLIFLSGEKIIKNCMQMLTRTGVAKKLFIIPLYGRLAKEEQERVFLPTPNGKKKVVISTNIAETSVTIAGITTVIDSGLAKLNYYSPRNFTSSLLETPVSKASCNQRKGRAGRTQEGICYRLYERKDFETRQMYTLEEIYRTDLSEVVLRMAELGITDFEQFDFISSPSKEGLVGAIETLNMLHALNPDRTLSNIGTYMVLFPLLPRQSRIIVEALLNYPNVIEEVLIASAFLSARSPFILPPGKETDARKAHHFFRDEHGDFVSYLKVFKSYVQSTAKEKFCEKNYLDTRIMAEIANIKIQLQQIVSEIGIPILSGGNIDDYLCCIASGMIQFVCIHEGRESYRSLTAERIQIHPGSCMFRSEPQFIVAGEIVRTSRMFAMSVSPLNKSQLSRIDPNLFSELVGFSKKKAVKNKDTGKDAENRENVIQIGTQSFEIQKIKGKKTVILPCKEFLSCLTSLKDISGSYLSQIGGLRGKILININGKKYDLLSGEKLELIIKAAFLLDFSHIASDDFKRKNFKNFTVQRDSTELVDSLSLILRIAQAKNKSKELGFVTLYTDGAGAYWYKISRGFSTAVNESMSSLETLIDETDFSEAIKVKINDIYRKLNVLYG